MMPETMSPSPTCWRSPASKILEVRDDDSFVEKLSYAFTHMSTLQERPAALMERVFHLLFDACEIESLVTTEQTQYIEHIMTTEMDRENILYTAEHRGEIRGEKRGEKRGEQRGEKRGEKRMQQRIALTFINDLGLSIEQVAQGTGLSVKELEKLLAKASARS